MSAAAADPNPFVIADFGHAVFVVGDRQCHPGHSLVPRPPLVAGAQLDSRRVMGDEARVFAARIASRLA